MVDDLRPGRQQTQRDLRRRTVMRDSKKSALGIQHANGIARRRIAAVDNIARKDPGMSAGGPIGRFAVHAYGGQVLSLQTPDRNAAFAPGARSVPRWKGASRTCGTARRGRDSR